MLEDQESKLREKKYWRGDRERRYLPDIGGVRGGILFWFLPDTQREFGSEEFGRKEDLGGAISALKKYVKS